MNKNIISIIIIVLCLYLLYIFLRIESFKSDNEKKKNRKYKKKNRKYKKKNPCNKQADCIIDDPCSKINCNYHLHPIYNKCVPKHIHHYSHEIKCTDSLHKNCKKLDTVTNGITIKSNTVTNGITIKSDTDYNINDNGHLICKLKHNNHWYLPECSYENST
jgi:hypothetical protein